MSGARFDRRARLVRKIDFRHVFEQPEASRDRFFTVLARLNALGAPRLGLAISRKSAPSAVARNRIKRLVRESFRHRQALLGGLDCVVIGRPGLTDQDNRTLFESLDRHWARLARRCASC